MKIAIHQPEHLPWAGFFHKMACVDIFVILDCVQFAKNNWQNRNRMMTPKGDLFWLTVPVVAKGRLSKTIQDTQIAYTPLWIDKYWNLLKAHYSNAPFFADYAPRLYSIIEKRYSFIGEFNIALIEFMREALGINNTMLFASQLMPKGKKTELIIDICKKLDATSYLSGQGGKTYLNQALFDDQSIQLTFDNFCPFDPTYYLSALHWLFMLGPEARSWIMNNREHEMVTNDQK